MQETLLSPNAGVALETLLLPLRTQKRLEHTGTQRCPQAPIADYLEAQRIPFPFLGHHCK